MGNDGLDETVHLSMLKRQTVFTFLCDTSEWSVVIRFLLQVFFIWCSSYHCGIERYLVRCGIERYLVRCDIVYDIAMIYVFSFYVFSFYVFAVQFGVGTC